MSSWEDVILNRQLEVASLKALKATAMRVSEEMRQERAATALNQVEAELEVKMENGELTNEEFWAQLDKSAQEIDEREENFRSMLQLKN